MYINANFLAQYALYIKLYLNTRSKSMVEIFVNLGILISETNDQIPQCR